MHDLTEVAERIFCDYGQKLDPCLEMYLENARQWVETGIRNGVPEDLSVAIVILAEIWCAKHKQSRVTVPDECA